MARTYTPGSGAFTITGGAELVRSLNNIDKKVTGRLSRGAASAGANYLREIARVTARGVGLGFAGFVETEKGNRFWRKGYIPGAIYSQTLKSKKNTVTSVVSVDSKISEAGRSPSQKKGGSHWVMVEFGSIHNAPRPFLQPALAAGAEQAVKDVIDVLERGVKRYNVPGGGGS